MPEPFYTRHVFICTNRVNDPRCCAARGSDDLFLLLRRMVKEAGLDRVAVTKTGCMGRCMSGPALAIYPDNVWYAPRSPDDVARIVQSHLRDGTIVTTLQMAAEEPPLPGYATSTITNEATELSKGNNHV